MDPPRGPIVAAVASHGRHFRKMNATPWVDTDHGTNASCQRNIREFVGPDPRCRCAWAGFCQSAKRSTSNLPALVCVSRRLCHSATPCAIPGSFMFSMTPLTSWESETRHCYAFCARAGARCEVVAESRAGCSHSGCVGASSSSSRRPPQEARLVRQADGCLHARLCHAKGRGFPPL